MIEWYWALVIGVSCSDIFFIIGLLCGLSCAPMEEIEGEPGGYVPVRGVRR